MKHDRSIHGIVLDILNKVMKGKFHLLILIFLLPANYTLSGQDFDTLVPGEINILKQIVVDGDTLLVSAIEEIYIFPEKRFRNRFQAWRYRRLIHNVKKAYPYAIMAKEKLIELDEELSQIKGKKARKKFIDDVEDELREEFEDELKGLTISQGRILIKLIDRETGDTSYELVKEMKGSFSAVFWQAIARLFGSNLKSEFDPEGEDRLINEIVLLIESGQL